MGWLGFGNKSQNSTGGTFIFPNDSRLSPEEYGYLAVGLGIECATEQTTSLFIEDSFGASLGLTQAIRKIRFSADIYTTTLEIGIYLWYAVEVLGVNDAVLKRIGKGIQDFLITLRTPNGQPLETEFIELLVSLANRFSIAIKKDVEIQMTHSPGVFRPQPLPSTALLLDLLISSNSNDPMVQEQWRKELSGPMKLWLQSMIEASTLGSMKSLSQVQNVRYVS